MENANYFVTSHRQQFKDFIDMACSIPSSSQSLSAINPSYSTPITMLSRLPPPSREGFPSLPYLIDHPRSFADLVDLWLDNTQRQAEELRSAAESGEAGGADLLKFHSLCVQLKKRAEAVLDNSEPAEKPSKALEDKWQAAVDDLVRESEELNLGSSPAAGGISSTGITAAEPSPSSSGVPPGSSHAAAATQSQSLMGLRGSTSFAAGTVLKSGGPASMSSSASHYAPSNSTLDNTEQQRLPTAGSAEGAGGDEQDGENGYSAHYGHAGYAGDEEPTALPGLGSRGTDGSSDGRRSAGRKEEKEKGKKGILFGFKKSK